MGGKSEDMMMEVVSRQLDKLSPPRPATEIEISYLPGVYWNKWARTLKSHVFHDITSKDLHTTTDNSTRFTTTRKVQMPRAPRSSWKREVDPTREARIQAAVADLQSGKMKSISEAARHYKVRASRSI